MSLIPFAPFLLSCEATCGAEAINDSSLSAASAFHGGGVGAGVPGGAAAGAGAPHMDTRAATTTAATVPVMDTAITVGLEWLNYRAGLLARAITMALSTESWDLRLGEQYGPTSATTDT
jgi:hypothetical protein